MALIWRWIAPDRKSKKKGATRIPVRVVEYKIDSETEPQTYRLITSVLDLALFPALLLAAEYHQRWEVENTIDEFKTHLNARKTPIRSLQPRQVVQEIYGWLLAPKSSALFNVPSGCSGRNRSFASR